MPVLRINATEDGLQHHASTIPLARVLAAQATQTGPIVIMLHGYKYTPEDAAHCPHRKLFNAAANGWPRALGFLSDQVDEGLCIAFAWSARGPLWRAHRRAAKLGAVLAGLIASLRALAPHRPLHLIAHSLGAEIALSALVHLPGASIDRMLLLTGASFIGKAQDMLATPAGMTTEVFNITSRENDLFDLAFEHLVAARDLNDRAIGQGVQAPNALNLQLDCDTTLNALALLGLPVARAQRRVSHWSVYQRPGVMALYAAILRGDGALTQSRLAHLLPEACAPRWSRFKPVRFARGGPTGPALVPLALRMKNRIMAATSAQGKNNEHAY
ncbi:hypothetical protein ROLI_008490 [Roseobacter fucihabitans]|uniref:AB hydrolase-1 domain-containing protein n=1 Tax=Roseobacter fucihabitans TaxID=1537242 RepID=A0ABZ2BP76_9RHOB|nr:alpha/beta hydrolase [Roseobacter litoralis]MBC6966972.1 hypothetical protein [Roseobacter litoralis]